MQEILRLMQQDKDALGFIPCGGPEGLQSLVNQEKIALACQGGEILGYAAYTTNTPKQQTTIHQCCVRDDARFLGTGRKMIEAVMNKWQDNTVVAKVREDLAANHFWQAIGFDQEKIEAHKTSHNQIVHYRHKGLLTK